jgi:hypothetical protein
LAPNPRSYDRYDNGSIDRQVFEAIGMSANCPPVPVATARVVCLELLDLGTAGENPAPAVPADGRNKRHHRPSGKTK